MSSNVSKKGMQKINYQLKDNDIECTMILLGETGVGKSTFINALANYLLHNSFEEARKQPMTYFIPASFMLTDKNYNTVKIKCGEDDNESNKVGESCTQNARSHFIKISNNKRLHIIDTPGIGDTRGATQDAKNMRETLDYISQYQKLNAICILVKPNHARLDLQFRFCLKELLVHLHKGAAPNIVFCFTNSRSTFYMPGDSYEPLKTLLKEIEQSSGVKIPVGKDNVFCFDNEAFRFLAAVQQGVNFSQNEVRDFSSSWERSSDNARSLLKYAVGLTMHDIIATVKLNEARRILMVLAKPIAEISQQIQTNIKLANEKKQELASGKFDDDVRGLEKKLNIPQTDLKRRDLNHPRTVCTASECITKIGVGEKTKVNYTQWCHPHCYLEGVATDLINSVKLKECECMDPKGNCKVCTHNWETHMHITYENEVIDVFVMDHNVKKMIDKKKDTKKIIDASIKSIDDLVGKLKNEQRELIKASAKFANFTRHNAIAIFNDDLDAYLELLIKEERAKNQAGATNQKVIDGLENVRKNYQEQRRIFDEAIAYDNGENSSQIDPDEIDFLIDDLFKLELNGKTLKSIVNSIKSKAGVPPPRTSSASSKYSSKFSANPNRSRQRSPSTSDGDFE